MRPSSVFVTVGTDHHPFERLIDWIDAWYAEPGAECFVQYGTSRAPRAAAGSAYLAHAELARRIRDAGAIVCHGGPGTIIDCLRAGTKPIVVPRRHGLGEHVDDHQVRFTGRLASDGYIWVAASADELASLIDAALASPARDARTTEGDVPTSVANFAAAVARFLPATGEPPAAS